MPVPAKADILDGVTCESCGDKPANKLARVRRGAGEGGTGDYTVRLCTGCGATYERTFGADVEIT